MAGILLHTKFGPDRRAIKPSKQLNEQHMEEPNVGSGRQEDDQNTSMSDTDQTTNNINISNRVNTTPTNNATSAGTNMTTTPTNPPSSTRRNLYMPDQSAFEQRKKYSKKRKTDNNINTGNLSNTPYTVPPSPPIKSPATRYGARVAGRKMGAISTPHAQSISTNTPKTYRNTPEVGK